MAQLPIIFFLADGEFVAFIIIFIQRMAQLRVFLAFAMTFFTQMAKLSIAL